MEQIKRPCKGDYLDKLLQPAILSLLCEGSYHGFFLLSELERRGLVADADATGFYRTLHKLEADEKLSSEWTLESGEKPKKVYNITGKGVLCLKNWQCTLKNYFKLVGDMSAAVDRAILKVDNNAL